MERQPRMSFTTAPACHSYFAYCWRESYGSRACLYLHAVKGDERLSFRALKTTFFLH